jgi:threonine synthase
MLAIIKNLNTEEKFILDPHTATAFGVLKKINNLSEIVILGTAHPYKFLETVKKATGIEVKLPQQLLNVIDKKEKFDIIESNISKIKNYILKKTT